MLDILRCPHCDGSLVRIDFEVGKCLLDCRTCGRLYPVVDGIAVLCDDSRKNKAFEIGILHRFLGMSDIVNDQKIGEEIKRIKGAEDTASWEWDDVEFWDKRYREKWERRKNYSLERTFDQWRDRLWQRAPLVKKIMDSEHRGKQSIILDVGSGEGQNMLLFRGSSLFYIAADMSYYALRLAKYYNSSMFSKAMFILCPADRIPVEKNAVDIIICFGILHHCPCKERTLLSLNPLLKERGYLVLHEPYERRSITPSFLKLKAEKSAHEERIDRTLLGDTLNSLECLMMEEGHSILFGFVMRVLGKIVMRKEWMFKVLMKVDKSFLISFGWMHPGLGAGDIRGVWRKK